MRLQHWTAVHEKLNITQTSLKIHKTSHFSVFVVPSWLHVNVACCCYTNLCWCSLQHPSPPTTRNRRHHCVQCVQTKLLQQWHGAPGHQKEPPLESEANTFMTWTCEHVRNYQNVSNVAMYLSVSLFKAHVVSSFSASPRDTSKHRFIFLGRGKQRTDVS